MAENKKSFILYCDIINTVQKLDDKTAGELFKHLLKYVNDEDPKTENILIDIAFEPIKQQLKRDLNKYEQIKQKRSQAGKRSAELRKAESVKQTSTNSTSVKSVQQTSTNPTVTVNDTVNVNVNDNVIKDNICKTPLDAVTHNQTDQDFLNFCKYISKLEKVREIKEQISFDNFVKLKKNYPKDLIGDKLEELNNWLLDPNIPNSKKKKKSVYHLMVNTWLKNKY